MTYYTDHYRVSSLANGKSIYPQQLWMPLEFISPARQCASVVAIVPERTGTLLATNTLSLPQNIINTTNATNTTNNVIEHTKILTTEEDEVNDSVNMNMNTIVNISR